jgi:Family of unknown function (DUF6390)
MTPGDVLFARYAYPPNQLGYCGPGDGHELFEVAAGTNDRAGQGTHDAVATRACDFDGAWPYLEIIAAAAGIDDPLADRVVEAYWVGNDLLDVVNPAHFARVARQRFATQPAADWACLDPGHPVRVTAHHSFHVFAVYPWMSMLRKGHEEPALTVLDRCRIRWGQVVAVHGDHVEVACQSLTWDGHQLGLGDVSVETLRWADAGRALSARAPAAPGPMRPAGSGTALVVGEWVSLHWDWVCDRLSPDQLDALRHFTHRQLDVTNRVNDTVASPSPR